jgi:hypothetical protein
VFEPIQYLICEKIQVLLSKQKVNSYSFLSSSKLSSDLRVIGTILFCPFILLLLRNIHSMSLMAQRPVRSWKLSKVRKGHSSDGRPTFINSSFSVLRKAR